jgi:hypothetical protein
MTRLVDALRALQLAGEVAHGGRWVELRGECHPVYVVEVAWGGGYFTWGDDPEACVAQFYRDPTEAIRAGLTRAAAPARHE